MNTIHTKPKWQPYITVVAPGYYGYNRVNTTGVCLYKEYNMTRTNMGIAQFMSTVAPAHY